MASLYSTYAHPHRRPEETCLVGVCVALAQYFSLQLEFQYFNIRVGDKV